MARRRAGAWRRRTPACPGLVHESGGAGRGSKAVRPPAAHQLDGPLPRRRLGRLRILTQRAPAAGGRRARGRAHYARKQASCSAAAPSAPAAKQRLGRPAPPPPRPAAGRPSADLTGRYGWQRLFYCFSDSLIGLAAWHKRPTAGMQCRPVLSPTRTLCPYESAPLPYHVHFRAGPQSHQIRARAPHRIDFVIAVGLFPNPSGALPNDD